MFVFPVSATVFGTFWIFFGFFLTGRTPQNDFLTRFGLLGLSPIDLSQKIAEKRDSRSSKSSSDDPFQAIFHFFIDFSREEREKVREKA